MGNIKILQGNFATKKGRIGLGIYNCYKWQWSFIHSFQCYQWL